MRLTSCVVNGLSGSIQNIIQLLNDYDSDQKGVISQETLKEVLVKHQVELSDEEFDCVFKE